MLPVLCLCLLVLCLHVSAAGEGYALHRIVLENVMFDRCFNLVGGGGKVFDGTHLDAEFARIDALSRPGYFTAK